MLLVACAFICLAQSNAASLSAIDATGTVTGHVFCSDTNQPARFAKVSLEPVHSEPSPLAGPPRPERTAVSTGDGVTSVDTALDGSFTIGKVKPGSYYVIVSKAGYVSPREMFTQEEIENPSAEMRNIVERALPRVDIDNGQTAHAEVRLERGAAISGTVLYDDGSPAGEIDLSLLHKDMNGKWMPLKGVGFHAPGSTETDDRGNFRFASLLPDRYMLKARLLLATAKVTSMGGPNGTQMMVNVMTFHSSLSFYGEGTPHESEAKPIKLLAGEELTGQDMTLPTSKLFRVTGRVTTQTGHAVNAAVVKLVSKDDGKEITSSDIDRYDGLFHFDFVPAGEYTLQVSNARDVVWEPEKPAAGAPPSPFPVKDKERILESYGSGEQPLTISGDMLGIVAAVQPDAKKSRLTEHTD